MILRSELGLRRYRDGSNRRVVSEREKRTPGEMEM